MKAIEEILAPGGLLSARLPGYESRPGQLAMAERVAHALENDERLLIEAGTGTGKTLAYLVPAVASGRKVVISTGTKTLQDQIAAVDLPRLKTVMPDLRWAVMKGIGNYLCRRRLQEQTLQMVIEGAGGRELNELAEWASSSQTGERSELRDLPDDSPLWRDVAASPESRVGVGCGFFQSCFVSAMKRRAAEAQVILTNHHLYFADMALRTDWPEAHVLPPHEAVIFDEAHQIEDVATEFFGLHVSMQRLFAVARDLSRALVRDRLRAAHQAARVQSMAGALGDGLRRVAPQPRGGLDESRVRMPDDLWTGDRLRLYHDLDGALEEVEIWLHEDGEEVSAAEKRGPELAALGRRAQALRSDLGKIVEPGSGRDYVRWLAAGPRGFALHASPVDVAPMLSAAFRRQRGPIIFTSATLSVAGGFAYVRRRLGLGDTADEAVFPSPFSYRQQALLYLPTDLPEPKAPEFPAAVAARAEELCAITGGRAMLLFTSFRNLRAVEQILRPRLPYPLLVQGERPRHVLLESLRRRIGSVLLATQSFWEGVDVPGEALSLVIIDKAPFDVPDDPLTEARIQRIREEGGDPFTIYQVPRAGLALKQGFGRLVRSSSDRGIVAILDGRLARKNYGPLLLAGLPRECPRTEALDEVAAFWSRINEGGAAQPAKQHLVTTEG